MPECKYKKILWALLVVGITGSANILVQAVDYGDQPLENPGDEATGGDGGDEAVPAAEDMAADADEDDLNADPPQVCCSYFF